MWKKLFSRLFLVLRVRVTVRGNQVKYDGPVDDGLLIEVLEGGGKGPVEVEFYYSRKGGENVYTHSVVSS